MSAHLSTTYTWRGPRQELYLRTLEANAAFTYERLARVDGLTPVRPAGAMYVMVACDTQVLKGIQSGTHFAEALLAEEAVFVLPGACFGADDFFRVVFSAPRHTLEDAYDRIEDFCRRRAHP